jgi:hypothetical protein
MRTTASPPLDGTLFLNELSALAHKFGDVFSGSHFRPLLLSGEFGKDSFKILSRVLWTGRGGDVGSE